MQELRVGFGYENPNRGAKDEWLTPPEIVRALGPFDLDPCSPIARPWATAENHFTIADNGLLRLWDGRVWCNPPYGPETGRWMAKLAAHGNGIGLIFARTETKAFQEIFSTADGFLFLAGRLRFYHVDGTQGDAATAPSVLVAYGAQNVTALRQSGLRGAFMRKAEMM